MLFFGILVGSLHYYRCRHCKNLKATFWRPSSPPPRPIFFRLTPFEGIFFFFALPTSNLTSTPLPSKEVLKYNLSTLLLLLLFYKAFQRDMKTLCARSWLCRRAAGLYFVSVRRGGVFFFKATTPPWCLNSCAKDLGDPNGSRWG